MTDKERLTKIKKHLSVLIKRNKYDVAFELHKKWYPTEIIDPRSGEPFTHSGAWDYILEQLEDKGTIIKEIELENPKGRKGYVILAKTKFGNIYIKIHFSKIGNSVIGRSFHYSK